jgi:type III pantothenate kinase
MILAIDVGNTNIKCGVYEGERLLTTFRLTTRLSRTSDEYGMMLTDLLAINSIDKGGIAGVIVTSVVPSIMYSLTGAITRYIGISPLIVGPGTKTGIKIVTENPREIGADRVVNVVAGYELYGGPILVLDFGTATT